MSKNSNIEPDAVEIRVEQESDLPSGLSKPAIRALTRAGFLQLEQFSKLTEAEVLKLHGMGPKGIVLIRQALAAKGKSFADGH